MILRNVFTSEVLQDARVDMSRFTCRLLRCNNSHETRIFLACSTKITMLRIMYPSREISHYRRIWEYDYWGHSVHPTYVLMDLFMVSLETTQLQQHLFSPGIIWDHPFSITWRLHFFIKTWNLHYLKKHGDIWYLKDVPLIHTTKFNYSVS